MPPKDALCSSLTEINPVTNWLKKTLVDADRWTAMAELSCEDFMDQRSRVTAQTRSAHSSNALTANDLA